MSARGFSLVELVIVIVLLGILAAVAAPLLAKGFDAWFTGREVEASHRQAELALERMTRELRVGDGIVVAADEITYERDEVPYSIEFTGAAITLNAQPIAQRVTAAAFTDEATEDTRYITVTFTVDGAGVYRTTIHPRRRQ